MRDANLQDVVFDADLISRYDGRGPRYTSYPAATQFTPEFTADDYSSLARRSNLDHCPLSIYVHIPFCHSLCYYCGCNKIVTRNQQRVADYLDNLGREIQLQSELFADTRKVEQLHFGGGTPTYLDADQMTGLMQSLARAFEFGDAEVREFSIEVDPRTVTAASLALLAELGFNRLSLGVQDFDSKVQQTVNRVQSKDAIEHLLASARQRGFKSVSFDLIYGLPLQTPDSFSRTLDAVIRMRPDRLAVYNYAHLPARFKGQRMIAEEHIPTPATKLKLLQMTIEKLGAAGYCYVGMDHFALPDDDLVQARHSGTLQRNFQGYSTHRHCDLVGLGVSAISHIANSYSQNAVSTADYQSILAKGNLPTQKGIIIDDDDLLRADVIQSLMCYDELQFADVERRHAIHFHTYFADELARLENLQSDGLIRMDDRMITVTAIGRLLMRNIAMQFDRHLRPNVDSDRFSRAI